MPSDPTSPPLGFACRRGDNRHEVQALFYHAIMERIPRQAFASPRGVPKGWVPVGNVAWVEGVLGRRFTPDYAPAFLQSWLRRKTWTQEHWPTTLPVFLKPADRYKRFNGVVVGEESKLRRHGPFFCSEVVQFIDEWRYYLADGRVFAAHWYAGDELTTPAAPSLDMAWPAGWCGAVDFGRLSTGEIALIEAHHPYACGWYGRVGEGKVYAEWLLAGWRYLNALP